ncbi:MAG TPA: alpha-L-arabinofuranosidase C-terminal domain-containing protein [Lacunisphaera sp.]|nr:alpha-L-arabinofuranosidase C-terminal domain-containing protein [Lacunisphaera sp.]
MKKLHVVLPALLATAFTAATLTAGQPALIKIDLDRTIGAIDPNIYSSFLEPVERGNGPGFSVVYGALYDPKSPQADANGFRKEYLRQIKDLKVSSVRWPGGNFVSGYHWEDGIGPKDQRPVNLDLSRSRQESNQMGTDEYAEFCKLVGAENFICINAGTGTIEDAAHWVEYCNAPAGTRYANLRVKYGHPEPYKVKYWALGNEPDGPWQLGHKNKEDYAKFAIEAAKTMRAADKDIRLIAAGASNYPLVTKDYDPKDGWTDWNDYVLDRMAGYIDYISLHRYVFQVLRGIEKPTFADQMSLGLEIDHIIKVTQGSIEKAMAKSGTDRPIYISFDEYGARGNNLAGPLLLAQHLNAFIRHADIVKMANLTFLSSLVGLTPTGEYKTSLYYPFDLYSNHCRGTALEVYTRCDNYSNKVFQDIPNLDVTAVLNDAEGKVVVNVVNRSETEAIPADIELQSGAYTGKGQVHLINADSIEATNTATKEQVRTVTTDLEFTGNKISHTFPAHSLTQLEIALKKM